MPNYPKSLICEDTNTQHLIIHGQGVFLFKTTPDTSSCSFILSSSDKKVKLNVIFTESSIRVVNLETDEPYIDKNNKSGLVSLSGAYFWFSLDSQNQKFYAGVGEPRMENASYKYEFPIPLLEGNKLALESLSTLTFSDSLQPLKLLRDPITQRVPLYVKDVNHLTMNDVALGGIMPSANLNAINQKLYACVSGERFVLDDPDFPEFSKAIEYSIATPGLWCNRRLLEKATEFNKDKPNIKETYLRITLGLNNGESPGIPYVMEIWPVGHYSPVHNHAFANAVIRVLHGSIHVKLFPFLCDSPSSVPEFASADFKKDDVTWISENLNQVHQLKNLESNTDTCITIQCYMYSKKDLKHYDYFDYLDSDVKIQQYEPDSDMDFISFKNLMKTEWNNRPKSKVDYMSMFNEMTSKFKKNVLSSIP